KYTSETVAARMVDGLGFRYYWATEGLREADLNYRPGDEARTSKETLQHIYELTKIIVNTTGQQPTVFPHEDKDLSYHQLRERTLLNIQKASEQLKLSTKNDLNEFNMVFQSGDKKTEYPFWNLLNGPIADAIWHVGQVVSFRRSSGNPINSKAEVLLGKLLD
ncbi:MAG: hypothetical protein K8H85_18495, partial [Cyclobacteriaceae bacterium]|nr:hypothetical protein [Cyclobacteriaceae bacterium]